jgi:hypothetical protein
MIKKNFFLEVVEKVMVAEIEVENLADNINEIEKEKNPNETPEIEKKILKSPLKKKKSIVATFTPNEDSTTQPLSEGNKSYFELIIW